MSQSFDDDHSSRNSLPLVDRPKTTRDPGRSTLSKWRGMDMTNSSEYSPSSPEEILMNISPFSDRSKTRSQKKRNYNSGNENFSEKCDYYPVERNLVKNGGYTSHTPRLQCNEASPSSSKTPEKISIQNTSEDNGRRTDERRSSKTDDHKSSFMHLLLSESSMEPFLSQPQDFLCDSGSRRETGLRKRQALRQEIEGKRFSPMQAISNHHHFVPRLNIPPDIGIERENTLIGLSRNPGCQATPSTPEDTNRSNLSSDKRRDAFVKRPNEMIDPLEEIIGNQPVSERKYSILPSIGTPIMMRKIKGQNSHRNQLDYKRDRYESDAEFFSDYNGNTNTPEVISTMNPVPLPPIQKSSETRNSSSGNSLESQEDNPCHRNDDTSSPKIPFSERLTTESTLPLSK